MTLIPDLPASPGGSPTLNHEDITNNANLVKNTPKEYALFTRNYAAATISSGNDFSFTNEEEYNTITGLDVVDNLRITLPGPATYKLVATINAVTTLSGGFLDYQFYLGSAVFEGSQGTLILSDHVNNSGSNKVATAYLIITGSDQDVRLRHTGGDTTTDYSTSVTIERM